MTSFVFPGEIILADWRAWNDSNIEPFHYWPVQFSVWSDKMSEPKCVTTVCNHINVWPKVRTYFLFVLMFIWTHYNTVILAGLKHAWVTVCLSEHVGLCLNNVQSLDIISNPALNICWSYNYFCNVLQSSSKRDKHQEHWRCIKKCHHMIGVTVYYINQQHYHLQQEGWD